MLLFLKRLIILWFLYTQIDLLKFLLFIMIKMSTRQISKMSNLLIFMIIQKFLCIKYRLKMIIIGLLCSEWECTVFMRLFCPLKINGNTKLSKIMSIPLEMINISLWCVFLRNTLLYICLLKKEFEGLFGTEHKIRLIITYMEWLTFRIWTPIDLKWENWNFFMTKFSIKSNYSFLGILGVKKIIWSILLWS